MMHVPYFDRNNSIYELECFLENKGLLPAADQPMNDNEYRKYQLRYLFIGLIREEYWALIASDYSLMEDISRWAMEKFREIIPDLIIAREFFGIDIGSVDARTECSNIGNSEGDQQSYTEDEVAASAVEGYYHAYRKLEMEVLHIALSSHPDGIVFLMRQNDYNRDLADAEEEYGREVEDSDDPDNEPAFDESEFKLRWISGHRSLAVENWFESKFAAEW